MFYGGCTNTIDAKGRIVLPAKMREELGEDFVITRGFAKCLALFTRERFNVILEKAKTMKITDPSFHLLTRGVIASAADASFDAQGRILVPPPLRKYAELTKNVSILGAVQYIELWDEDGYNDYYNEKCTGDEYTQLIATLDF